MATMDERDIKFGSLPSSVNEANVLRLNLAKKSGKLRVDGK
jgi:hypothetical protein